VTRVVRLAVAIGLVGGLLVACGSSDEEAAAPASTAASPTPTPTPSAVIWAGEVCVARDNLNAAVSALGRNLSYDITSDRSALEQIDRQLRIQVLAVGDAANDLGTTLVGVPADLQEANDFVVNATKAKADADEAVAAVKSDLDDMVNADNILDGVASAGSAVIGAKAAFEAGQALVTQVTDLVSAKSGELSEAFDAAPQCQS
jgi:hypothetical protein